MALRGVKVLELAGLAPSPFCGMILSDFGASVVRIDKTGSANHDVQDRGKRSLSLNLKNPQGVEILRKLSAKSDVIIEPFRAGVMERLGLGPDILLSENPGLIYARLTGFGQTGPYSKMAGHDINYLAISGLLSRIGRKNEPPLAPINLLADFAGGGMTCAFGILAALLERSRSGKGQVVDASMVDGAAYVGSWIYLSQQMMLWGSKRGENMLDSGSHFYETYRTKDDKFVAVGAIEPQFYAELMEKLGVEDPQNELPQLGADADEMKSKMAEIFATKTRQEWAKIFDNSDACVTPVLELDEAPTHPHNHQRNSFIKCPSSGHFAPAPAPRLSRTPAEASASNPIVGEHTSEILTEFDFTDDEIANFHVHGVVGQHKKSKL